MESEGGFFISLSSNHQNTVPWPLLSHSYAELAIKKIEDPTACQVTYSKRMNGIIKKAVVINSLQQRCGSYNILSNSWLDNFFFQWKSRECLSAFLQCSGKPERRLCFELLECLWIGILQ